MPKKITAEKFRLDLASDLDLLRRLISRYLVCRNSEILSKAINDLKSMKDGKGWAYSIEGIIFDFISLRNIRPLNANNIFLELSISVKGLVEDCYKIKDPFTQLEFNIVIHGESNQNTPLLCSFHLDRHIESPGNANSSIHPIYHMHFGGHRMDFTTFNFGQLILLESPRFAHYPMELILGIDFILSNFFYEKWLELREDGQYTNLIRNYQNLFLKPYVKCLNGFWGNDKNPIEWDYSIVWPHL